MKRALHGLARWSVMALSLLPAAASGAGPGVHPEPARSRGWSWALPPDLVTPSSEKRNHVFYVGEPVVFALGGAAATYEVRDYWGDIVDRGDAGEKVTLHVEKPGWYKLYVYGRNVRREWGDIVGGTTFVVFRDDRRFPALPPKGTSGGWHPATDMVMRGVAGIGPHRHRGIDAGKPDETIQNLSRSLEIEKKFYTPFDPVRGRPLMVGFAGGTSDRLDGVRRIVARFKDDILYWEPRNEPNFGASGADFARNEMKPFYDAVKSANPRAKVMGPGTVSVDPKLLPWIDEFLRAGGGKSIDVFSFHIYNGVAGDIWVMRWTMDGVMALLKKHGIEKIEKWQTEQSPMAAHWGLFQPRIHGRWTMLMMMVFEQYGIPKEHNNYWYDKSHGFWDFPSWWENDDGGLNPGAALLRVWSEELFGKKFERALDFGPDGNKLLVGSLFGGAEGRVAAIMNVGCGRLEVELGVKGGRGLRTISPFGEESETPLRKGVATLTVTDLPVYVELEGDQTIEPVRIDWGTNLARQPGVKHLASGTGKHPYHADAPNGIEKITNGAYENWWYGQTPNDWAWMDDTPNPPAWVEVELPASAAVGRVVMFAGVPYHFDGTLMDYELQYDSNGRWVTVERVTEPAKTFGVFTPPTRTTVDMFFEGRWVFEHVFEPVKTRKVRVLMHAATCGVAPSPIVGQASHNTLENFKQFIEIREIEIYGPGRGGPGQPAEAPPAKAAAPAERRERAKAAAPAAGPEVLMRMARNYIRNGQYQAARDRLNEIQSDYPDSREAAEARALLWQIYRQ